jgi:hypothetical protein
MIILIPPFGLLGCSNVFELTASQAFHNVSRKQIKRTLTDLYPAICSRNCSHTLAALDFVSASRSKR